MAWAIRQKWSHLRRTLADSLEPWLPEYLPVAWKLGLAFSALVVTGMAVLGFLVLNSQLERMQRQTDSFGASQATQLANSAREPLLAEDDLTLKVLVNNLTRDEQVTGAALFGSDEQWLAQAGHVPEEVVPGISDPTWHWEEGDRPLTSYISTVRINDSTAGHALVTLSREPINAALQEVRGTVVTTTIVMAVTAIMLAIALSRWLVSPLQKLLRAARAMRSGDLHQRIEENRRDELGDLIDAYNNMARGLLEKRQVEEVLSRFVSPSVARRMMADLDQVQLGGREVEGTVVFADIVGFTRLTEDMPPDQVAALLNDYFDAVGRAAEFYRGTIDKYMGDCAMIVFGVTENDPEHLYHGLCCAVMIQHLTEGLNRIRQERGLAPVQFRIGINHGPMLAGNLGSHERMQYTVVGDTVNLASRLSSLASPGETIIPETVVEDPNIRSRIKSRPAGTMEVRGRRGTVTAWRLEGVHAHSETLMSQQIARFITRFQERHADV